MIYEQNTTWNCALKRSQISSCSAWSIWRLRDYLRINDYLSSNVIPYQFYLLYVVAVFPPAFLIFLCHNSLRISFRYHCMLKNFPQVLSLTAPTIPLEDSSDRWNILLYLQHQAPQQDIQLTRWFSGFKLKS